MSKLEATVSVIMPVYNEAKSVPWACEQIHSFMCKHFTAFELLIIESGSSDGTADICDQLADKYAQVRVIHEGGRNGFGSALKLGYKNAVYDYCWLVTADLPFSLDHILEAIPLLEKYDFILSYRSSDDRELFRRFQSFVYNAIIKVRLGLRVKSVNSAFKLLPTKVMAQVDIISRYWFIDAEVLYRLIKAGYTYTELPVPLIDRSEGVSTVGKSAFLQVLKEMNAFCKVKKQVRRNPYSDEPSTTTISKPS